MSNSSNKFTKLALIGALALTLNPLAGGGVSADTQHPHPTYKDTWNYGVTSNGWAYSHYYLEAPIRLGSGSSVTEIWGNVKDYAKSNYGWANSGATKHWSWIQAKSFYSWYEF